MPGPEVRAQSPESAKRDKWDSLELKYAVRVKSVNNEMVYHGTVAEICRKTRGGIVCYKHNDSGAVVAEVGSQEKLVVNYISKTNSKGETTKTDGTATFLYTDIAEFLD